MNFGHQRQVIVLCVAAMLPTPLLGWSSKASRTENTIHTLKNAISAYFVENRALPDASALFENLVESKVWFPRSDGTGLVDSWGHGLVVQFPGIHEEIRIHSIGPDGIDQAGDGDDISTWAGVNDGYHYKSMWPIGRGVILVHSILSLGFLGAARWLRWPFVLSLSGILFCIGLIIGCQFLKHPGMVPDRNGPLDAAIFAAEMALVVLAAGLFYLYRSTHSIRHDGMFRGSA